MDELIQFHFKTFDDLFNKKLNITDQIEQQINEVKEKLKDTFNQESKHYTSACHYLDKKFDEYIESKKTKISDLQ